MKSSQIAEDQIQSVLYSRAGLLTREGNRSNSRSERMQISNHGWLSDATLAVSPRCPQWNDRFEAQLRAVAIDRLWAFTKAFRQRCPDVPVCVAPIADGFAAYHGGGAASFVRELGTTKSVGRAQVLEIETFYFSRGLPARIWISDRTDPELLAILRQRGYVSNPPLQTWWRSLNHGLLPQVDTAEVSRVDVQDCEQWARAVTAGFAELDAPLELSELEARACHLFYALGCGVGDQAFLAKRGHQPVGGAVLNVFADVAMLRTASTRFPSRNTGIQQTLIAARLRAAIEQGASVAVLQTPPGPSAHNAIKFGFQPLRLGGIAEKPLPQGY